MTRADIKHRVEIIHGLCIGLAPKQAVGEALAALLSDLNLPDAPAVAEERVDFVAILREYRCQYTMDIASGDGLALVDKLSNGKTTEDGENELKYLADHLAGHCLLAAARPGADKAKGEGQ